MVTTAVEHSSVLDAVARGTDDVTVVGVDRHGRFDAREVAAAVRPDTVLVSVQLANHEVGTLQPVDEIVGLVHERANGGAGAVVHVDACAAAGHVPVDFAALGADLCSVTGHTFGGAQGCGSPARAAGAPLPAVRGGWCTGTGPTRRHRERPCHRRLRRGVHGDRWRRAGARGARANERCPTRWRRAHCGASTASSATAIPSACLPHLVCLGVEGVEAEPILLALDQRGVAVHSGSSCSSESLEPSPVLTAMGVDADRSLRASVGWSSTTDDVDAFLDALPVVVGLLRELRG